MNSLGIRSLREVYKHSALIFRETGKKNRILAARTDLHSLFRIIRYSKNYILQEKATPLRNVLREATSEEAKVIIDKYFDLINDMFSQGFYEMSFNFYDNFGVDKRGSVFIIDVGEICFNKDELVKYAQNKMCIPYTVELFKSEEIKSYFLEKNSSIFSEENIQNYWAKN